MKFVMIDVETANPQMASICQIGVVGFENGQESFADSVFVDPEDYFHPINISIHGIGPEHVVGAPNFHHASRWLDGHLRDQIVISHTAFDRTALSQAASRYGILGQTCRWLDSARIARRAWPQYSESGFGLKNLAKDFGIRFRHHDALEDARAAGLIVLRAISDSGLDVEGWFARCAQPLSGPARSVARTGDGDGPLVGETVVITGTLSQPRQRIADLIHEAGGAVDAGVTKRTTFLVVGDQDVDKLAGKDKSSKHMKAEELIGGGYPIRILQESDLFALLN